jgi:hypothetical protein
MACACCVGIMVPAAKAPTEPNANTTMANVINSFVFIGH